MPIARADEPASLQPPPRQHQPIGLRIYGSGASMPIGRGIARRRRESSASAICWRDPGRRTRSGCSRRANAQWVRGVVRLNAGHRCLPCHQAGTTLGRRDHQDRLHAGAGRHPGAAAAAGRLSWSPAGSSSWASWRSRPAARYGARCRGSKPTSTPPRPASSPSDAAPELPLDPVAAALHGRLREFLRRQREREAEVASRLAHVDQLASLGQLSAGLAHEIKNPLAGIQGALEVLRDETDDASTAVYDEMLGELKRVNGILQRLLDSGRPAPLRLARTDLARLVARRWSCCGRRCAGSGSSSRPRWRTLPRSSSTPRRSVRCSSTSCRTRPRRWARRAGTSSSARARSRGERRRPRGRGRRPRHRRRGPAPHLRAVLHHQVQRARASGWRSRRASIEQHGGTIEVELRAGPRHDFFVFLPGRRAAGGAAAADGGRLTWPWCSWSRTRSCCAGRSRSSSSAPATRWTRPPTSPRAAHLAAHQPDVVLLDLGLPDGHGLEFYEANRERLAGSVVIVMTASAQVEEAVRAMKLGALDFLTKPVDQAELVALVDRSLAVRGDQLEAQAARQLARAAARRAGGRRVARPSARCRGGRAGRASEVGSILIQGESGSGKNVVARTSTPSRPRRERPLIEAQLRDHPREPARERALRPREGRLHRRQAREARRLRAGRRRHGRPRRDRRAARSTCRRSSSTSSRSAASAASAARARSSVDVRVIGAHEPRPPGDGAREDVPRATSSTA